MRHFHATAALLACIVVSSTARDAAFAQNTSTTVPPIIDVHQHAMEEFGSLAWPKLMAYSISIIQNADYLTTEQKRDILYNNAARFLRLDPIGSKQP
jgi:hypothetical protein